MRKDVTILGIEDGKIIAGCDRNACEGCKSSTFCRGQKSEFEVLNPEKIEVAEGDRVSIQLPTGRTIFATAMSLIFPLLCFFAGLAISYHFIPERELLQFVWAIVGLAIGFTISKIYFHFKKGEYTPSIEDKAD